MNYLSADLSDQVQSDYLEYAAATLQRALPDVYDGLIPARRRILQTMIEEGIHYTKPYVKCARTTGLTSAYYHPHGSAYGSLISMATPWNNTLPWIDCHGNIGSTVDSPAAERYVENRLTEAATEILLANKDTWETRPNYDGSRKEAIRLDAKIPAVLLNGTEGISVGYSTKVPQHNLRDLCKAVCDEVTLLPDFPTGCLLLQTEGLTEYLNTGSGTLRLRAKHEVGEIAGRKSKPTVTFTNLPPSTNPESIGSQIKLALDNGKLTGITEVIDLSNLAGDCVQVIGKPGVDANTLAQQLYAHTNLETTYSARNLVLDGLQPKQLPSREIVAAWKTWRLERLRLQFAAELDLKEFRHEIVAGLIKAVDKIDAVIKVIRAANSPKEAIIELVSNRSLKFTSDQARAILEMRLRSLTNLDASELEAERVALEGRLAELGTLTTDVAARLAYLVEEVRAIGVRYGEARRSALVEADPSPVTRTAGPKPTGVTRSKPRFVLVDPKTSVVTRAKGPRGAIVLENTEKLIIVTQCGTIKKVPPTYTGPVANTFQPTLLAKRETDVSKRNYLVVFEFEQTLRAMCVPGIELCRTTSKGKQLLPQGANVLHFGEQSYIVNYNSSRKKSTVIDTTIKVGKPGQKGIKIANIVDVNM